MLKLVIKIWWRMGYLYTFKLFINYKGKNSNSIVNKSGRHHLSWVTKASITKIRMKWHIMCLLTWCIKNNTMVLGWYSSQNVQPEFKKSSGKPTLKDILLSNWTESESRSVMSESLWPQGIYSPWISLGQNTGVSSLSLLQGIFPTKGLNPTLPHCRQILYQLSHKGKPQNTGVGSLSLLQWIFPTQELNWGLLHCRWILYQLSYFGSHETKMYPQKISRSRNTQKN